MLCLCFVLYHGFNSQSAVKNKKNGCFMICCSYVEKSEVFKNNS